MSDYEGSDPSEVFLYRGEGSIPRNAVRVEVHRSVRFVPNYLFQNCRRLESVLLHDGLRKIGRYAFLRCSSLRSLRCPRTVVEIGKGAFYQCSNLATAALPDGLASIEAGTFRDCTSLEEADIPASVRRIGFGAFSGCANLTSVVLRDGLQAIGDGAFDGCRALGGLSVPPSVDEIGGYAFNGCGGLSVVRLREDLPRMKKFAFRGCPPGSFRFVRLSERREAIHMDEQTHSVFEDRLNEIANAMTRDHEDMEAAGTIWEKCQKSLERAHEVLAYLELKGGMSVLELALWKAKVEDEGEVQLQGDLADVEDRGKDARVAARARKRCRGTQPSREDFRVKCGAGIVSAAVRKFFSYSVSWPGLDDPE